MDLGLIHFKTSSLLLLQEPSEIDDNQKQSIFTPPLPLAFTVCLVISIFGMFQGLSPLIGNPTKPTFLSEKIPDIISQIIGLIQSEYSRKFKNLSRTVHDSSLDILKDLKMGHYQCHIGFLLENLIVIFQKKSKTNHVNPSHISTTLVSDGDRFYPPLVHQKSCPVSDLVTNRPNLEINERASTFQYKRTSDDEATKSEEARRNSVRRESVNSKRSKHQNFSKMGY